jgi:hypothetical protein
MVCTRDMYINIPNSYVLFNAKWAIFLLFHGKNKLRFDEMMMTFTLFWMEFYGASSLKKQSVVTQGFFSRYYVYGGTPNFILTVDGSPYQKTFKERHKIIQT